MTNPDEDENTDNILYAQLEKIVNFTSSGEIFKILLENFQEPVPLRQLTMEDSKRINSTDPVQTLTYNINTIRKHLPQSLQVFRVKNSWEVGMKVRNKYIPPDDFYMLDFDRYETNEFYDVYKPDKLIPRLPEQFKELTAFLIQHTLREESFTLYPRILLNPKHLTRIKYADQGIKIWQLYTQLIKTYKSVNNLETGLWKTFSTEMKPAAEALETFLFEFQILQLEGQKPHE